jgi:hypothetical protein
VPGLIATTSIGALVVISAGVENCSASVAASGLPATSVTSDRSTR